MGSYLNFNNYNPYTGNANIQRNQPRNEPSFTTMADIFEETGGGYNSRRPDPNCGPTTMAYGEEGGGGYNPPPPHATTRAVWEEGGGGYNPPPPHATTRAVGEEGGGGYNPPPPVMTTQAMGEEGGGGYNPPPVMTTQAMGEEGGGGYNPLTIANVDDVNLQDAQKVHKDADQLDGKLDNKASANQFEQLKTKLSSELIKVKDELKVLPDTKKNVRKRTELTLKVATLQKELETVEFMLKNKTILSGAAREPRNGVNNNPNITFANLERIANQVNEVPNEYNTDKTPKKLISEYDLRSFNRTLPIE